MSEKARRICFVGGGLAGGGQERSLTTLANFFSNQGIEVYIISIFKTECFYELNPGIKLIWPEINRRKHNRYIYAILLIPYLRNNFKKIKPDVVLSIGEWFNSYVIISTRLLRIKLVVSNRMSPLLKLGFPLDLANKLLYRYADGIIAQTNIAREIIYKKTRNANIIVIPNAVRPIDIRITKREKQIVTLGRLSSEKGHSVLLKAFAKLNSSEWTLHIIGDGPIKKDLEHECFNLRIQERVIFYGQKKDFSEILGNSSIFVLPSFSEGFPNALIEAMSVPLPCISSDCIAGPVDIIQDGVNGLLFRSGHIDELHLKLETLISSEKLRESLSREAYKVREKYKFNIIAERHQQFLFDGIIK
jgi:GalNAc-alpha-(1->4)-GalNAc-alpha-(1->3)-diNAcBac-PP-undecaprenol alpha-1,4-N-acetyl-D-galactosaminyltransferase